METKKSQEKVDCIDICCKAGKMVYEAGARLRGIAPGDIDATDHRKLLALLDDYKMVKK